MTVNLFHQFSGISVTCEDALDVDDSGRLTVGDPVHLLVHLFLGGPAPSEPFAGGCGEDPAGDSLRCEGPTSCFDPDSYTLDIVPGMAFESLWGEAYTTIDSMLQLRSVVRLRPETVRIGRQTDTEGLDLVESVLLGPDLNPGTPLGTGTFSYSPGLTPSHVYRQSFQTDSGVWTFTWGFSPDESPGKTIDCEYLDTCGGMFDFTLSYGAELENGAESTESTENTEGAGVSRIFYSCFCEDSWSASAPFTLTLEDGTQVTIQFEDGSYHRGIAGETFQRRLASAVVTARGQTRNVDAFQHLMYGAYHHNATQEYRVVLDPPIEEIHGIDVVECPPPVQFPTFCLFGLGKSRAHYLDASQQRVLELEITARN